MVDITDKSPTLRTAIAQATVQVGSEQTIRAIKEQTVPKGDVFSMSKAAGLLGIKKTADLLPDCHPIPIENASIDFAIEDKKIKIQVTVKTIYKTGVEVEAMHGASVVALNMYDMLKPLDKNVQIEHIKLIKKTGGKSDNRVNVESLSAQVIVCSDSVYQGDKQDKSGKKIKEILQHYGIQKVSLRVVPDEATAIEKIANDNHDDLLIFTGGTGVGPRDVTPDTIAPLLELRLNGVEETMRRFGQDRMQFAMLSRSVAGIKNGHVILCVPGSTNGAKEAMDAVLPGLFHVFYVLKGGRHD
ncbi:MAG: bifunctional molybdenum cofactor biosynthesis protein MoaC/MoaB [Bacteroidota bacterium]